MFLETADSILKHKNVSKNPAGLRPAGKILVPQTSGPREIAPQNGKIFRPAFGRPKNHGSTKPWGSLIFPEKPWGSYPMVQGNPGSK